MKSSTPPGNKNPLKVAIFFGLLTLCFSSQSQTITIHSISQDRQVGGDYGYTLNGQHMNTASRIKLLSPKNFGPAGIYPKTVSITDGYSLSGSLVEVHKLPKGDLFFVGTFNSLDPTMEPFTSAEVDTLYNWSLRGGKMIITSGLVSPGFLSSDYLNAKWGYVCAVQAPSTVIATNEGKSTDLFSGPFGTIEGARQSAAAQGFYHKTPQNVKVMAVDKDGRPTIYHDCNTLDLLVIDTDVYTSLGYVGLLPPGPAGHPPFQSPGVSFGDSIKNNNNNDKLWANSIVFMDKLQGPPILAKTKDQLALDNNYLDYQWFFNDTPIEGPQSNTCAMTSEGKYYAKVTVNGGCVVKSNEFVLDLAEPASTNECNVLVPDAFSPDNNGVNDQACVYGADCLEKIEFKIFNRWGELIFEANDVTTCWNGTYKGAKANSGVYAWTINGKNTEGKFVKKGTINLIR